MNVIYGLHLGDRRYRYIGLTSKGTRSRLSRHKAEVEEGSTTAVYCWMAKHGLENIHISVLECVPDKAALPSREVFWIKWYRDQGYDLLNHTDGGEGCFGYRHTEEARKIMSVTRTGRKHTEATRSLMSETRQGRRLSKEACANISKGLQGRIQSDETKAKISQTKTGTTMSQETRKKMEKWWSSEKPYKGVPLTTEHREKLSVAATGRKATDETKKKMSDRRHGVAKTPEMMHQQYHVSRGRTKPETCKYCKEEIE